MSEVAKKFRRRRFCDLSDRDKRDILKLMARVAEQAYRRGVQQGAGLAGKSSFRGYFANGATVRRSTYRRGSTVRRRLPASIGSMPSVARSAQATRRGLWDQVR